MLGACTIDLLFDVFADGPAAILSHVTGRQSLPIQHAWQLHASIKRGLACPVFDLALNPLTADN